MSLEEMKKPPYIKEQSIKYTTSSFCDGTYVLTEEEWIAHRLFKIERQEEQKRVEAKEKK